MALRPNEDVRLLVRLGIGVIELGLVVVTVGMRLLRVLVLATLCWIRSVRPIVDFLLLTVSEVGFVRLIRVAPVNDCLAADILLLLFDIVDDGCIAVPWLLLLLLLLLLLSL
ncbi:hypothetical protein WICPIJ_000446 [Wickerhamomyces pijperi]|uniref:Uncharacterized protein n=1 Tax=Wickerhamomyces pijperi TaxID=599730 RepID=A0A9P8TRX8_WICPI|nr:hypothetical protein WICPIJ_000446 [Wickerhamomyces pijperi]